MSRAAAFLVEQMEREHTHLAELQQPRPRRPRAYKGPSQKDRVLTRLRVGPVKAIDFLLPDVCDDGKPITRVARAIGDLERDGHRISHTTVRLPFGTSVTEYTLIEEASGVVVPLKRHPKARGGRTWLWVATSDRAEWCGHWHHDMGRAVGCARSHERYYRLRYGERQEWRITRVNVPLDAHVSEARRAA